jgi:hypothetical protein
VEELPALDLVEAAPDPVGLPRSQSMVETFFSYVAQGTDGLGFVFPSASLDRRLIVVESEEENGRMGETRGPLAPLEPGRGTRVIHPSMLPGEAVIVNAPKMPQ